MSDIDQIPSEVVSHLDSYFEEHADEVVPASVGWFSIDKRELRIGDGLTKWKDIAPFIFREDLNIDSVAGQLQQRINELEDELNRLQSLVNSTDTSLANRITSLENVDKTHNSNISTINGNIKDINTELVELSKRLDDLLNDSSEGNSSILADIADLRQQINTLSSQVEGLQNTLQTIVSSIVVDSLDDPDEFTALSTQALSAIISTINNQISTLHTSVSGLTARFDSNGLLLPSYGGTGVSSIAALKNLLGIGSGGIGTGNVVVFPAPSVQQKTYTLPAGGSWLVIHTGDVYTFSGYPEKMEDQKSQIVAGGTTFSTYSGGGEGPYYFTAVAIKVA